MRLLLDRRIIDENTGRKKLADTCTSQTSRSVHTLILIESMKVLAYSIDLEKSFRTKPAMPVKKIGGKKMIKLYSKINCGLGQDYQISLQHRLE